MIYLFTIKKLIKINSGEDIFLSNYYTMLILLFSFLIINSVFTVDLPDYYVSGLRVDFSEYGNTTLCKHADQSCYKVICDYLNKKDSCIAYVSLGPFLSFGLNCTFPPTTSKANIIVSGLDNTNTLTTPTVCLNLGTCLSTGCNMYNKNNAIEQILFTGQCI